MAIYQYCGENWNDSTDTRGNLYMLDGEIIIAKRCLVEPEIYIRKNKGKQIIKRIIQPYDIYDCLARGDIEVSKPCTSEASYGVGFKPDDMYFARRLLNRIFPLYQEEGKLPQQCIFIV